MLAGATIDAVRQWTFRPYVVEKDPVEVETTVTVEFSADPPHVIAPRPPLPQKLRVSRAVAEGMSLQKVTPSYPEEARNRRIQGEVVLNVVIDKQGNVVGTRVVSGYRLLADAAVNAVKQWKYRPYPLNGEPVEIETTIKIQFRP